MSCVMLLTVTLDGGLEPLPELEADGGHHEAGVRHELPVPHLTRGMGMVLWVHTLPNEIISLPEVKTHLLLSSDNLTVILHSATSCKKKLSKSTYIKQSS